MTPLCLLLSSSPQQKCGTVRTARYAAVLLFHSAHFFFPPSLLAPLDTPPCLERIKPFRSLQPHRSLQFSWCYLSPPEKLLGRGFAYLSPITPQLATTLFLSPHNRYSNTRIDRTHGFYAKTGTLETTRKFDTGEKPPLCPVAQVLQVSWTTGTASIRRDPHTAKTVTTP